MEKNNLISKEEVKRIAELARINLQPEEEEKFAQEIGSVLDYFKDISQLELESVENFDHYDLKENYTREDLFEENKETEKAAIKHNFPREKGGCLSVKAVL
jgi:aspartyl-tRNA(Asn)/glutamyl-tRNA(Gln) amidotransferase subunit C